MNEQEEASCNNPVEAVVICRWWNFHPYSKWEDLYTAENIMNQPLLIQEKRCTKCNHAKRRTVHMK